MSWVKLDDKARGNRKLLRAGAEACWLWTCGLMYCNEQPARDGFIPREAVACLYPVRSAGRLAKVLVETGLWEEAEGGFRVHDYHDFQPSAEQAAKVSSARAEAGKLGGTRSGESRRASKPEATCFEAKPSKPEAGCFSSDEAKPNPVPDPDPDLTNPLPPLGVSPPRGEPAPKGPEVGLEPPKPEPAKPPKPKRAPSPRKAAPHVLPADWQPSDEHRALARELGVDCETEAQSFRDHAAANGRTQVDWAASFRTWLRKSQAFASQQRLRVVSGGRAGPRPHGAVTQMQGDWKPVFDVEA
jgi:hypothetical protein